MKIRGGSIYRGHNILNLTPMVISNRREVICIADIIFGTTFQIAMEIGGRGYIAAIFEPQYQFSIAKKIRREFNIYLNKNIYFKPLHQWILEIRGGLMCRGYNILIFYTNSNKNLKGIQFIAVLIIGTSPKLD